MSSRSDRHRAQPPLDFELQELLQADAALLDTALLVHATTARQAPDAHYQGRLRAQLMAEATNVLVPRRPWFHARGGLLAWGGLALGGSLVAATAALLFLVPFHPAPATPQAELLMTSSSGNVDPNTAITVAFNVPMNESAVDAGIEIQPATAYTTSWHGNDLVIVPTNPLANDTPYTVTIAQSAARSSTGTVAQAPIQLTFGTAPSPSPSPTPTSAPPTTLTPTSLGPVSAPSPLVVSPSGSVVVDGPNPSATASASSSPSAGPTAPPSPSSSVAASALASPSSSPQTASTAVTESLGATGGIVLGPASSSVAYSPDMNTVALAVPTANGGSSLEIERSDGSGVAQTLATFPVPVVDLAWSDSSTVVVVTADNVIAVPLSGQTQQLAAASGTGSFIATSSTGRFVIEANGDGSSPALSLVDLASNSTVSLPGSSGPVSLSADGTTVSWLDTSSTTARIDIAPAANPAADILVPLPTAVSELTALALNDNGSEVAVIDSSGNLELVNVSTGTVMATLQGPIDTASFDANTNHLALISGTTNSLMAELVSVPSVSSATTTDLPAGSLNTLDLFIAAQVHADSSKLTELSSAGADAEQLTPARLSRGYVIATSVRTSAAGGATVTATARLILDASGSNPVPMTTDETVVMTATAGGLYQVTQLSVPALAAETVGPHVIHVGLRSNLSAVEITFDSDLDPTTLATAISIVDAGGQPVLASVHYDPVTRTATLTLPASISAPITVTVSTALHDINNDPLASAYSITLAS